MVVSEMFRKSCLSSLKCTLGATYLPVLVSIFSALACLLRRSLTTCTTSRPPSISLHHHCKATWIQLWISLGESALMVPALWFPLCGSRFMVPALQALDIGPTHGEFLWFPFVVVSCKSHLLLSLVVSTCGCHYWSSTVVTCLERCPAVLSYLALFCSRQG